MVILSCSCGGAFFLSDILSLHVPLFFFRCHGKAVLRDCGIFCLQYNRNGSNTNGSFTVDDSKYFFSSYKILPIAQENKYLGIFFLILS